MTARIELHATVAGHRIGPPVLSIEVADNDDVDRRLAHALSSLASKVNGESKYQELIDALANWGSR